MKYSQTLHIRNTHKDLYICYWLIYCEESLFIRPVRGGIQRASRVMQAESANQHSEAIKTVPQYGKNSTTLSKPAFVLLRLYDNPWANTCMSA